MTVSLPLRNESAIFLDEATFVVEANLHALLHDLAHREQSFVMVGTCKTFFMQLLVTFFPEWDIADVPNGMRSVVFGLYVAGSIRHS